MRYLIRILGVMIVVTLLVPSAAWAGRHSLGAGAYYLKTLGDIKDNSDFDEDALSWLVSYQFEMSPLFTLEGDVEFTPDYGASDEVLYQPQAYLLLGSWIYAGAGIGIGYLDGNWNDDPFYALRAGLDLPLGDRFSVDINANYRFLNSTVFDDINEEDADAIMFGATLRYWF